MLSDPKTWDFPLTSKTYHGFGMNTQVVRCFVGGKQGLELSSLPLDRFPAHLVCHCLAWIVHCFSLLRVLHLACGCPSYQSEEDYSASGILPATMDVSLRTRIKAARFLNIN